MCAAFSGDCDRKRTKYLEGTAMTKMIPLTVAAGALACIVAAGSAQAAPASGVALGKLTNVAPAAASVDKVYWRHRYWRYHHRRHWRRWWW
jgi:hypothetical protein